MTEDELEEQIRQHCLARDILRFHVRDARGMTRGLPDDILIGHRGSVLWRECKSSTGTLSTEQRQIRNRLLALGEDWALWRPADLRSGLIVAELEAIR
jgi:hypothetical protein